ncbi:MAG: acyl-ACP--UDP-N-acetylglucosamine O-acyltransferase [Planctomycetota bacterium]
MNIHPTAIVERGAELGRNVEIGAFGFVGPHVVIGDGCRIHHHATLEGYTTLGEGCEVFPQAVLGTQPQDVKFHGERTTLQIGRNNIFREMVTAHPGTENGGGITEVGDRNLFLIGVHIAHDCHIGNNCILANYVQFAGHVRVEDNVNMGGHSAVHHFVTIGKHAFIGGMTRVAADVPPFMVVVAARGSRSEVRMVNGVGLKRSGYGQEDIEALKDAFMKLYSRRARSTGTAMSDRVQSLLEGQNGNPHVRYLCESLVRSFAHGRHGRYLESLRPDPVHRKTWRVADEEKVSVTVIGQGKVQQARVNDANPAKELFQLTAMADPGWTFSGWNGQGLEVDRSVTIVVNGQRALTATFARV